LGSIKVPPTTEYGMAVGMVDCDQCFVEDNLAALVGKRAQTNESMGKRRHDIVCHCRWGKCRNGGQSSACNGVFRASVGYRDADSWGTWVVVGNGGAAREVEAAGARVGNTCVLMRKGWGGSWSWFNQ
jgi:hypothetical protein